MRFNLGVFALVLEAVSAVALLATSSYLISRASEQPPIMYLMTAVVGVRAFALGRAAFRYLHRLGLHDAVLEKMAMLRPVLFAGLARAVPNLRSSDQDLETITGDVERLQDWTLRILGPVIQVVTAILASVAIVGFWFQIAAVWVLLGSLIFVAGVFWIAYAASSKAQQNRIDSASSLRVEIAQYLQNQRLYESYGMAANRRQLIQKLGQQVAATDRRFGLSLGLSSATLGFGAVLISIGSGWFAVPEIGEVPGHMLALALLTPLAVFDIGNLIQGAALSLSGFKKARDRVSAMLGDEQVVLGGRELGAVESIQIQGGEISREAQVLISRLDFTWQRGESVALVGRSGSGKTTLAYQLCGLLPPPRQMLINGLSATAYSRSSLSRQVLLVEQQPHIFAGTIRDNLLIAGEYDDQELERVLSQVGLLGEFAERGGLDATTSEWAQNLSGGQAQRLAIARGLLSGASMIILDEPTSGLDWDNALGLASLLLGLAREGRGVLVITHDPEFAALFGRQVSLDALS